MSGCEGWDMNRLVDPEAGKLYQCPFCLCLPRDPKMCTTCEHVFCTSGLEAYQKSNVVCVFRCINPIYVKPPMLIRRTISEMKIKCELCNKVFNVEQIDQHDELCQKPKCESHDCIVLQKDIKKAYTAKKAKLCSLLCKYTYMMTKLYESTAKADKGSEPKESSITGFSAEARKLLQELIKDPEIQVVKPSDSTPRLAPYESSVVHKTVVKFEEKPAVPAVMRPISELKWCQDLCGQNITLSDSNMSCYLQESEYCFRSVVANNPFTSGIHYWEIYADGRTENEIKIGVACKTNFNLNTAFCDYDYGWGYYGLAQLRHGNNSTGPKYGKPFKNSGYVGVYLNMTKGQLSFALNGEFLGVAFEDEELKKGPLYAAVSLLHKAGCKLVVDAQAPSFFTQNKLLIDH